MFFLKNPTAFFLLLFVISCMPPWAVETVSQNDLAKILLKKYEQWDKEDCTRIIAAFTWYNEAGHVEKRVGSGTSSAADVFIKATPLNKHVVQARMRKDAIVRRWSDAMYKQRLKAELEYYTNWTLMPESGRIISKASPEDSLREEITFLVSFENISRPYRTIEMFRVEEGAFLEDQAGEFARVIAVGGRDYEENFFLVNELRMELTFSLVTDNGKKLTISDDPASLLKLVFNGLQTKPVKVAWFEKPPF